MKIRLLYGMISVAPFRIPSRYILYFIFYISYLTVPFSAAAQIQMRSVFAAMPDSVQPMVTKNNKLDCIDFIENNMEAKVRNKLDEYVTLETLTADYARFRTSAVSLMELKLLPTSDSTTVLCVVTTAQVGEEGTPQRLEDSTIRFFQSDWTPLPKSLVNEEKPLDVEVSTLDYPVSAYVNELIDISDADGAQAIRSLEDYHPVRMALAAEEPTLTLTLQTAQLSKEERVALAGRLHDVILRWDGRHFIK